MYEKVRMEMSERVNAMMELDNVSHINLISWIYAEIAHNNDL